MTEESENPQKLKTSKRDGGEWVVRASEIAEHTFCPVAWDHRRRGTEARDAGRMAEGVEAHRVHGLETRALPARSRAAWVLLGLAVVLLGVALLWPR